MVSQSASPFPNQSWNTQTIDEFTQQLVEIFGKQVQVFGTHKANDRLQHLAWRTSAGLTNAVYRYLRLFTTLAIFSMADLLNYAPDYKSMCNTSIISTTRKQASAVVQSCTTLYI